MHLHTAKRACRESTRAKPWSKPASAYATCTILTSSKSETAELHKQWLHGLRDKAKAPILLYTDGSKMGEEVAAGYCQISVQGKYTQTKNISLGKKLEIMNAELAAVYQALQDLHDRGLQGEDTHIFIDSQAAIKRLQKTSLTGGQRVCHETTVLCKMLSLQNNKIYIS
jgi:hypothetical protein